MRCYPTQHQLYGGIDLHVDWRDLCGIDADGAGRAHPDLRPDPTALLQAVPPFGADVVVCVACLFTWDLARRSLRG
jgi:hypothetical protein